MNDFCNLVKFEYKKIFMKKANVILLAGVIVFTMVITFLNATGGIYYHFIGNSDISTIEALVLDKEVINTNRGFVTDEMIRDTIILAQDGYSNKENYFYNTLGNEVLKAESQTEFILPYKNIHFFLNNIFRSELSLNDGTKPIVNIDTDSVDDFYKVYKQKLVDNINQNNNLTQGEKNKHIGMIEQIQEPFYNEYAEGWFAIRNMLPYLGLIILSTIAIVVGNIFGKEYVCKADAIILSSKNGKSKFIIAKIVTAISFAMLSSIVISACYIGTYLCVHGLDGINVPLQFLTGFEFSTYPITMVQFVAICSAVFLVTAIAFSCFCATISAICNHSVTAISTLMLCVFTPMFIPTTDNRLLNQIMNCLFTRILNGETIFSEYFYTFRNISFTPYIFYGILMSLAIFICISIIYKVFKNHQVE